jgi:hypothetical protein
MALHPDLTTVRGSSCVRLSIQMGHQIAGQLQSMRQRLEVGALNWLVWFHGKARHQIQLSCLFLRRGEGGDLGAVAKAVGNWDRRLRRDDGIASGGEVNHALGGRLTEGLPAIDLAHGDLA